MLPVWWNFLLLLSYITLSGDDIVSLSAGDTHVAVGKQNGRLVN
jgi:hypothetical protein